MVKKALKKKASKVAKKKALPAKAAKKKVAAKKKAAPRKAGKAQKKTASKKVAVKTKGVSKSKPASKTSAKKPAAKKSAKAPAKKAAAKKAKTVAKKPILTRVNKAAKEKSTKTTKSSVKSLQKGPNKKVVTTRTAAKPKPRTKASKGSPAVEIHETPTTAQANETKATPKTQTSAPRVKPVKKVYRKPLFPIKPKAELRVDGSPLPTSKTNKAPVKKIKLSAKFLELQKGRLLELRDHMLDQMQGVAQDSLRSKSDSSSSSAFGMHQADAGSDAYEKDFALSLLSQEQDALYEIEEAIKRIETSTYGVCEMSGESIPLERLEAIPFARFTIECQKNVELQNRSRNRWDTTPQFMESADNFYEEDEDSGEEEAQKLKN
ncbi:MAG: TraR/DksA C4-type zinc finger protein [Verrucomicrobiota bacterium]